MDKAADAGASARAVGPAVADWLSLTAAPAFAVMAMLNGLVENVGPDPLCSADRHGAALSGMVPMYLLMCAFHLAPWLRWIAKSRARRARLGYGA